MTWFKLTGEGAFHAKVLMAGNEAYGAWVRAGQWSSEHLTEGFIPHATAKTIATPRIWRKLRDARPPGHDHGLVEEVEGGWDIHDYLDWNPTADQVEAKRGTTRERLKKWRDTKAARRLEQRHGNADCNGVTHPSSNAGVTLSPSPSPSPEGTDLSHSSVRAPEAPEASVTSSPPVPLLTELLRLADEGHPWCIKIRDSLPSQGGRLTHGQRQTVTKILAEHAAAAAQPNGSGAPNGHVREGPHYVDAKDALGPSAEEEARVRASIDRERERAQQRLKPKEAKTDAPTKT